MVLRVINQLLLLHVVIVAATSQFVPPAPYPYFNPQAQQGQMMQMPNGQPMPIPMSNSAPMMPISGMPPMVPHLPRLPGPPMMPPPMNLPMSLSMNGARLPMVVMPHYSKKADKSRKKSHSRKHKKRKRIDLSSSSSESSCSDSDQFEFRSRNKLKGSKKRRQVLTPVVSYVTKDGYVVYQKKIKKDKAKEWLDMMQGEHGERKEKNRLSKHDH